MEFFKRIFLNKSDSNAQEKSDSKAQGNKRANISLLISFISMIIYLFAFIYQGKRHKEIMTNTIKRHEEIMTNTINNNKEHMTINMLLNFDSQWNLGTFKCGDYLLSISPDKKLDAYKGNQHFSASKEQLKKLDNCAAVTSDITELLNKLTSTKAPVNVNSKIASQVKQYVQESLNVLDFTLSNLDLADKCKIWNSIKSTMTQEKIEKLKMLINDWRRYGNCSTTCYNEILKFISDKEIQDTNAKCSI